MLSVDIVFSFIATISVAFIIWAIARLMSYLFGPYSHDVYVPTRAWTVITVVAIMGILIPILFLPLIIYIVGFFRSAKTLAREKEYLTNEIGPAEVVDAANNLIIDFGLTDDDWVINVWKTKNRQEWIDRLSKNKPLLKELLIADLQIHATTLEPLAGWIDIVKRFIYMEEQYKSNNTPA